MATKKKKDKPIITEKKDVYKIMGCDLSMTGSAFAILIVEHGEITHVETYFIDNMPVQKKGNGYRLNKIGERLEAILQRHPDIDYTFIERGFHKFRNATQIIFRVVGVVERVLSQHGIQDPHFVAPTRVKSTMTGHGKANKTEVAEAVQCYLPRRMDFKSLDETDAIAIAISMLIQEKVMNRVTSPATTIEK